MKREEEAAYQGTHYSRVIHRRRCCTLAECESSLAHISTALSPLPSEAILMALVRPTTPQPSTTTFCFDTAFIASLIERRFQ